jgi:peptidoglycan/xylan/chitin deacetylase (PgdA/CDA1 family)
MLKYVLLASLLLSTPLMAAKREQVALTFDDLPSLTMVNEQSWVTYNNEKILKTLKERHWKAIGFVNEGKVYDLNKEKQIDTLKMWLDAGMDMGNHSFSHDSPNNLGAEKYVEDIAKGELIIRPLMFAHDLALHWYRHPYLQTGTPKAVKDAINLWLKQHDYDIAPVTMENSDWMFAEPYDVALAHGDTAHAEAIKAAYLAHSAKVIPWYIQAGHSLFNRPIAHTMLLHVNRLNADALPELAKIFTRNNVRIIPFGKAMKDPAYRLTDPYAGADGHGWLERWADGLHKELPWESFTEPPQWVQDEYNKVDK